MSDREFLLWLANHLVYQKNIPATNPQIDHLALMCAAMSDKINTPNTGHVECVIGYPTNSPPQTDLDHLLILLRKIKQFDGRDYDFVLKLASIIQRYIDEKQVQLTR